MQNEDFSVQNDLSRVEEVLLPVLEEKTQEDREKWKQIRQITARAFKEAGLSWISRTFLIWKINKEIKRSIRNGEGLLGAERRLRAFFRNKIDLEKTKIPNYINRAERNFLKVKEYIVGTDVLDLGAGDGFLGQKIRDEMGKNVTLVDVVDYNYSDLPLLLYTQDGKIPLEDNSVDTTIMYVILHHADNPGHVIEEAARVTRKRFIILEGYVEDKEVFIVNSFIDWFFNRVIRDADINVPLNYKTRKEWEEIFRGNGFEITEMKDMGIDEPVAPEHHILYIVDRIKKGETGK